jgi:hypothetical protein
MPHTFLLILETFGDKNMIKLVIAFALGAALVIFVPSVGATIKNLL